MGNLKSDERFDAKQAYNTSLTPSARLHYLENNRHDHRGAGKMLSNASPAKNQNKGYADSRELTDMPLTKDMTSEGGSHGSWMSKHASQRFSSPLREAKPDYIDADKDGNKTEPMKDAVKQAEGGSMAKMVSPLKDQGYNNRLDDALGGKHGHKSQPLVDRRHESEGMERHFGHHKFAGDKNMK